MLILKIISADKISSTLPKNSLINTDVLTKSIGFQNIPKVMTHYKRISKASFHIQDIKKNCFYNRGNYSTIPKRRRNTTPIKPTKYILHHDIFYSTRAAIVGIKCYIVIPSRTQRYTFTFSLKYLGEKSLLNVVHKCVATLGHRSSIMMAE